MTRLRQWWETFVKRVIIDDDPYQETALTDDQCKRVNARVMAYVRTAYERENLAQLLSDMAGETVLVAPCEGGPWNGMEHVSTAEAFSELHSLLFVNGSYRLWMLPNKGPTWVWSGGNI